MFSSSFSSKTLTEDSCLETATCIRGQKQNSPKQVLSTMTNL